LSTSVEQILAQDVCRPNTELGTALGFDSVTHGNNDIKVVEYYGMYLSFSGNSTVPSGCQGFLDYHFFRQFAFFKDIINVKAYVLFGCLK
jgi:hypothetical protein